MKIGANSKKIFLNPKSNFTICEEKNQQQLKPFKKVRILFQFVLFYAFWEFCPGVFRHISDPDKDVNTWKRTTIQSIQNWTSPLAFFSYFDFSIYILGPHSPLADAGESAGPIVLRGNTTALPN